MTTYIETCEKVGYETYADAKCVLNKKSKIGRVYGKNRRRLAQHKPKRVYKCPECGMYHLTSYLKK